MADQYSDIFAPNYSVTGIRSLNTNNSQVIITGSCPPQNPAPSSGTPLTQAMIYSGPLNPIDNSRCQPMTPIIPGKSVTSSLFYGPDTHLFNPSKIPEGNIRAVGTYRYATDPQENVDHGVLYEGPPNNSGGSWTPLDLPSSVVNNATVRNTIPHSTMGELIVGNYNLKGDGDENFNAFIYNINTGIWQPMSLEPEPGVPAKLVTAYGIWQNGINSTSYTIAGGLDMEGTGVNVGYLVDYDSGTMKTSNLRTFRYHHEPTLITHFEGITQCDSGSGCYSLAATGDESQENRGAAFAVVERLSNGSFGEIRWKRFQVESNVTTGNTVLTNNLFGIYFSTGNKNIQSYMASNL